MRLVVSSLVLCAVAACDPPRTVAPAHVVVDGSSEERIDLPVALTDERPIAALPSVAPPPPPVSPAPPRPPPRSLGRTLVSGRLPPEVIQRVVRSHFGHFRLCYENNLRMQPNLQGRVVIDFTIDRDGKVRAVKGGGDVPDQAVISCVAAQAKTMVFPRPEGGLVRVTYPIIFAPGA
jgi:hypothetical protein